MKKSKNKVPDKSWRHKSIGSVPDAEPAVEHGQFELTLFDYFIALLIAFLAGVWIFPYVGTTVNWDDLFYMNLSQHTTPQAWVLNRYGHIYLQKFFFWLTGDSITGGRVFWCFLLFSTSALVYWCAKMLAGKKGYIVGLVAVLFFCAQPIFVRFVGCTLADLTVMFLLMLATFVYMAFVCSRQKHRHLFIMILGLIFFWVVKSKETGICLAVLFFGLTEDSTGARSTKQFIRDIGWVCVGILAGLVLLMFLDMVFMADPWFSVRPSSIKALFAWNTGTWLHDEKGASFYTLLSREPILAAFLLYLFVGWKDINRNLQRYKKVVWLIPLTIMFFLIAVTIQIRTVSPWHYFMPAIPGLSIWAAQFFRFQSTTPGESVSHSKKLVRSLTVLSAFIIVLFLMHKTPDLIKNAGWKSLDRFYVYALLPLASTGLVVCASLLKKRGLLKLFLLSLCLFFIIYSPIKNNMTSLRQRVVAKRSEWRFEPYRVFTDELRFDKDVKILVSKDVHKRSWMLGRGQDGHCWMFNVFFNQKFDYDQFIDGSWEDILKANYTYAFLTWRDWKGIQEKHDVEHLTKNYTINSNQALQLILLKKR